MADQDRAPIYQRDNPLTRGLNAVSGGGGGTVLPPPSRPLPPPPASSEEWGAPEVAAPPPSAPPAAASSTPPPSSEVTDFLGVNLTNGTVVADNGTTYALLPEEVDNLKRTCFQIMLRSVNQKAASLAKKLGIEVKEATPDGTADMPPVSGDEAAK